MIFLLILLLLIYFFNISIFSLILYYIQIFINFNCYVSNLLFQYIKNKPLKIEKYIGHSAGTVINRGDKPPFTLFDYEGLIVSFKE